MSDIYVINATNGEEYEDYSTMSLGYVLTKNEAEKIVSGLRDWLRNAMTIIDKAIEEDELTGVEMAENFMSEHWFLEDVYVDSLRDVKFFYESVQPYPTVPIKEDDECITTK